MTGVNNRWPGAAKCLSGGRENWLKPAALKTLLRFRGCF